ncbi:MAG TPA: NAD(P)-binding domain-containing protein [Jatrophihabitans sp.]|jgi:hypothetical protein
MKFAVLGTGMVGRAIAARLAQLGHETVIGTRDVDATLARTDTDAMGTPPFREWQQGVPGVALKAFDEVGANAEIIVNATSGQASLAALEAVGTAALAGKIVIDIANPLDFSNGMPPVLSVANTDSLGEQIQRAYPGARVVKTLNTMNASVMIDPARVPGQHNVFLAGEDSAAKATVGALLADFGWPAGAVIDLGGIRAARGTEMYLPLWLSLWGALGTGDFNIAVVRGQH